MEKKQPINTLKRDSSVNDIYAIKSKRSPIAYTKGWRFEALVGDATGSMPLKFWGGPDEARVRDIYQSMIEGGVIEINARVNEFQGKLELSMTEDDPFRMLNESEYDPTQFIPVTTKNIEAMWQQFKATIDSIKEPTLRIIVHDVFKDPAFIEKFKKAPAAMHTHHAWIGGLMEHTLDIVALCEQFCKAYPRMNRDLVISGALLHDLGKLDEYGVSTTIRTTPIGVLVGHLTLQVAVILRYQGRKDIDDNMLYKLAHMVISHHGSLEFGSPKIPAFPEALLLSYIDALDARMARLYMLMDEADPNSFEMYDKKESRNIYLR